MNGGLLRIVLGSWLQRLMMARREWRGRSASWGRGSGVECLAGVPGWGGWLAVV
jgi:hypothetical protein